MFFSMYRRRCFLPIPSFNSVIRLNIEIPVRSGNPRFYAGVFAIRYTRQSKKCERLVFLSSNSTCKMAFDARFSINAFISRTPCRHGDPDDTQYTRRLQKPNRNNITIEKVNHFVIVSSVYAGVGKIAFLKFCDTRRNSYASSEYSLWSKTVKMTDLLSQIIQIKKKNYQPTSKSVLKFKRIRFTGWELLF